MAVELQRCVSRARARARRRLDALQGGRQTDLTIGVALDGSSPVVPAARLVLRGLGLVMWSAQTAAVLGVVGVKPECDELAAAARMVVGIGAECLPAFGAAEDAPWVAGEDADSESGSVSMSVASLAR